VKEEGRREGRGEEEEEEEEEEEASWRFLFASYPTSRASRTFTFVINGWL